MATLRINRPFHYCHLEGSLQSDDHKRFCRYNQLEECITINIPDEIAEDIHKQLIAQNTSKCLGDWNYGQR